MTEGKWVYMEDKNGQDGWRCSRCRFFEPWYYDYHKEIDFIANYRYCPRCGSKMLSFTGYENLPPIVTVHGMF